MIKRFPHTHIQYNVSLYVVVDDDSDDDYDHDDKIFRDDYYYRMAACIIKYSKIFTKIIKYKKYFIVHCNMSCPPLDLSDNSPNSAITSVVCRNIYKILIFRFLCNRKNTLYRTEGSITETRISIYYIFLHMFLKHWSLIIDKYTFNTSSWPQLL